MGTGTLNQINLDKLESASRQELIELLEITESWASTEDSKFYLYHPNDVPFLFHKSPAKTRFLGGGNRSSKTYSHIIDYACQFTGKAPKSLKDIVPKHRLTGDRRLRFCVEDYPNSFYKVVWPYIQLLIPPDSIQDVVKDSGRIRAITNRKTGFLEFMFYDQETSKHQGTSRHSIGYDEEPLQSIRDEGLMRLVDTDGEETFSLTPTTGLRYLHNEIVSKRGREVQKDVELIYDKDGTLIDAILGNITDKVVPGGDPNTHVFYADIFDNKVISKEAAIRILNKYSKEEQLMRSRGYFMFLSGLIFNMYSDTVHLIDSFDHWIEDDSYKLYISIDPHPRVPHAVVFGVIKNNTLFVVDELFIDTDVDGLGEAIKVKCGNVQPKCILIDPSAFTPDPIKKGCFAWELMDVLDRLHIKAPLISGSKDLSGGILAMKRLMRVDNRGRTGLYVTENCKHWRREVANYSWDEWRKDTANVKGEKQKPIDKDDHFMEGTRRLVTFLASDLFTLDRPTPRRDVIRPVYGRNSVTGY